MWLVAADKRVEYAEDIYQITPSKDEDKLNLLCPTAHIRSRGDTLNRPTLTIVRSLQIPFICILLHTVGSGSCCRRHTIRGGHALARCG
jgi:hypothetical protein